MNTYVPGTVNLLMLIISIWGSCCCYSHSVDEDLRHGEEVVVIV